ncbi:hypothetical protein KJZ67_04520 [Patescibacteria group bacterium]|nr:hypothetical protein [Patescibacteria group bacterium]
MKEKVRPIYSELQGYLSQTPSVKATTDAIYDNVFWSQINASIDELSTVTGTDYSRYKIETNPSDPNFMRVAVIRVKLGGIISRLHGEFYSDEPAPFSGMPSTVNNFTQTQQQTATQTIILEFQEVLNEKITSSPNENEKSFLEKVKSGLGTIKSTSELVKLILETAKQFGFDVNQVATIFS